MTNPNEYWAEAVQVYFGQYERRTRGFTQPRTRAELRDQDPTMFALVASVFDSARLLRYWCDAYEGPSIPLPGPVPADGYARFT